MDIYIFVDNSCVEIFQCEKKNISTINEYLGELEADEIKYEIRVARNYEELEKCKSKT